MRLRLTPVEVSILLEQFTLHQMPEPNVSYTHFCASVDEVFSPFPTDLHMSMGASRELGNFTPNFVPDMNELLHVMHRVAVLCKARGYVWDACFRDFVTAPGTVNPLGQVTVNQFRRNFPFRKELGDKGIDLLITRYGTDFVDGYPIRVHFQALHANVSETSRHYDAEFPSSPTGPAKGNVEWAQDELRALKKVAAKVVERRLRLDEYFRDYDPLRKGFCTKSQLRTVFAIINISSDIDPRDYAELENMYCCGSGHFRYEELCKAVNLAFGKPHLERYPLEVVKQVDASTTAPARWNQLKLSPGSRLKFTVLEDKVRTWITNERMELRPYFVDLDRYHKGVVQRGQFKRVLSMVGMQLKDDEVELLADGHCNRGNLFEIDYNDFLRIVDAPDEDTKLARCQMDGVLEVTEVGSPYFDAHGNIKKTKSTSSLQSPLKTCGMSRPSSAASSRSKSSMLARDSSKVRPMTASSKLRARPQSLSNNFMSSVKSSLADSCESRTASTTSAAHIPSYSTLLARDERRTRPSSAATKLFSRVKVPNLSIP